MVRQARHERRQGQLERGEAEGRQERGRRQREAGSGHLECGLQGLTQLGYTIWTRMGSREWVGGEGMPGNVGRGRRVGVSRLEHGSGVAWRRVAETAGGRL